MKKRAARALRKASVLLNATAERLDPWKPSPEAQARFTAAMDRFAAKIAEDIMGEEAGE